MKINLKSSFAFAIFLVVEFLELMHQDEVGKSYENNLSEHQDALGDESDIHEAGVSLKEEMNDDFD